jgi:hypothetical protein
MNSIVVPGALLLWYSGDFTTSVLRINQLSQQASLQWLFVK